MLLSSIATKNVVVLGTAERIGKPIGVIYDTNTPTESPVIITDTAGKFSTDDIYANADIITINATSNGTTRGFTLKLGDEIFGVNGKLIGICKDIHMSKNGCFIKTDERRIICSKIVSASDGIILYNPKYRLPKQSVKIPEQASIALPAPIEPVITEVVEPAEKESDYSFMIGKRLKNEVSDIGRSFVLMAGTVITDRVIQNAKRAGKLTDLYHNVK